MFCFFFLIFFASVLIAILESIRRKLFGHGLAYFVIQRLSNDQIDQNIAASLRKILHSMGEDGKIRFL